MTKVPASKQRHEALASEDESTCQNEFACQDEVEAVLAEFGGDARAAIHALLHDLAVLAADAEASTSRGYVRGRMVRVRRHL